MRLSDALDLGPRELVAFVGAGGKKTAMQQLTAEGVRQDLDVGYTTTAAMPPPSDIPITVTTRDSYPFVLSDHEPPIAFAREWISDPERVDRKVRGFEPEFLKSVFYSGVFDWLLVKADGARQQEFKAPGADEPIIPEKATHVVPVVSVQAVGEPLTEDVVHRPERISEITDLSAGDTITPEAIGTVLASPAGGLKHVPTSAPVTPLVNKADTTALQDTARDILTHALEATDRFSRGVITSFEEDTCDTVVKRAAAETSD